MSNKKVLLKNHVVKMIVVHLGSGKMKLPKEYNSAVDVSKNTKGVSVGDTCKKCDGTDFVKTIVPAKPIKK